jgi:hypothetical protein
MGGYLIFFKKVENHGYIHGRTGSLIFETRGYESQEPP